MGALRKVLVAQVLMCSHPRAGLLGFSILLMSTGPGVSSAGAWPPLNSGRLGTGDTGLVGCCHLSS